MCARRCVPRCADARIVRRGRVGTRGARGRHDRSAAVARAAAPKACRPRFLVHSVALAHDTRVLEKGVEQTEVRRAHHHVFQEERNVGRVLHKYARHGRACRAEPVRCGSASERLCNQDRARRERSNVMCLQLERRSDDGGVHARAGLRRKRRQTVAGGTGTRTGDARAARCAQLRTRASADAKRAGGAQPACQKMRIGDPCFGRQALAHNVDGCRGIRGQGVRGIGVVQRARVNALEVRDVARKRDPAEAARRPGRAGARRSICECRDTVCRTCMLHAVAAPGRGGAWHARIPAGRKAVGAHARAARR